MCDALLFFVPRRQIQMIKDSLPVIMEIYNMDWYLRHPYNIYNDLCRSKLANDHLNIVEKLWFYNNICKFFFFLIYNIYVIVCEFCKTLTLVGNLRLTSKVKGSNIYCS